MLGAPFTWNQLIGREAHRKNRAETRKGSSIARMRARGKQVRAETISAATSTA
jgi:hypothetical protein